MDFPTSPTRSQPAHFSGVEDGERSTVFFVTVCTEGRAPILAVDAMHALLIKAWNAASAYQVGRYMIMPDHVHLFCRPGAEEHSTDLRRWVAFWKSWSARRWSMHDGRLWQRDFWDRQMRSGESYSAKSDYLRENPVRSGLVDDAAAWPYQGEMHSFLWRDR